MDKDIITAIVLIPVIFTACLFVNELANFVGLVLTQLFSIVG